MSKLNAPAFEPAELQRFRRISFGGYEFSLLSEKWVLNRNVTLSFQSLKLLVSADILAAYLPVIGYYATYYSAHHADNIHQRYLALLRFADSRAITPLLIIEYRHSLNASQEWQLGVIRILFCKWTELGCSGIDPEVVNLLNSWSIKNNVKGNAVKLRDAVHGPFSEIELQAMLELAVQAYEIQKITISELAVLHLVSASGRRSIQLTSMKLSDVSTPTTNGYDYSISIPRAKQRGGGFRSEMRKIKVTPELWKILQVQRQCSLDSVGAKIGRSVPSSIAGDIPLFLNMPRLSEISCLEDFITANRGDFFHDSTQSFWNMVNNVARICHLRSSADGTPLSVSPRRFRYTLGTRAAREGCGELVIAELLDHSDTQSAHIYVQNVAEYAARIDEAVGTEMVAYAQAFAGTLVDSKRFARRGDIPGSDIRSFSGQGSGTCGHYDYCGANVPIPCYTCVHFQPWLEGPHQEVYDELLIQRENIISSTQDVAIAAVLDRSIIAVAQVVAACQARKSAQANP